MKLIDVMTFLDRVECVAVEQSSRAPLQPHDLAVLAEPCYRLLPDGAFRPIRSGISSQSEQCIYQLPRSGRVGIQEALWRISDAVHVVQSQQNH
jgi:hypothetical protein